MSNKRKIENNYSTVKSLVAYENVKLHELSSTQKLLYWFFTLKEMNEVLPQRENVIVTLGYLPLIYSVN